MSAEGLEAALDTSTPVQLVRAAAALRWKRPDLTVTLAELALDAADDPATWVAAAGWLLHGRNLLGDGRQIACDLLDGLERWGDAGAELMVGPRGRRLRVELAGPARRTGEQAVARALLAVDPGADALDAELRADVLAELARRAADETPDAAGSALDAAEEAWLALGCEPGIASVLLVKAGRDRRAGRADAAVAAAVGGLGLVNVSGRRAGGTESDHLAAALTAEWIAALVDADRLDEARTEAVPAANRLLVATRPSRQLAGLRLAVARVAAATDDAEAVLAALEPAAQDAAAADVPELESACRSMLGELHEAAGRLDAALAAVRAAMTAERRDHDRGARLRVRLATVTATWAARPTGHPVARYLAPGAPAGAGLHPAPAGADADRGDRVAEGLRPGAATDEPDETDEVGDGTAVPSPTSSDRTARARSRADTWSGATGAGRRARRLAAEAAEAAESASGPGWPGASLPELGTPASATGAPTPTGGASPSTNAEANLFDDATAALRARTAAGPPGPATEPKPMTAADGGTPATGSPSGAPARTTDTGRAVAVGAVPGSASLIGDALLRELIDNRGRSGAPAGGSRPLTNGHDHADALADSRTDRWGGGHGVVERGHRTSANGVSPPDGRSDRPSAPQARETDPGVDDTVVFELDPRHDSTVAVPPVLPTRGTGAARARRRPGRGTEAGLPQPEPTDPHPPHRAPDSGHEAPAATPRADGRPPTAPDDRRAPVGADTGADPVGADTVGVDTVGVDTVGAGDPRRRSTPDTDGLGIGDLLAGALAAYRGI